MSATDLDDGINGRVRYTIISGDNNHDLTISEDNGLLRIAKNLNYERKAQYSLTIQAEDCGGDTDEKIRFDTATVCVQKYATKLINLIWTIQKSILES